MNSAHAFYAALAFSALAACKNNPDGKNRVNASTITDYLLGNDAANADLTTDQQTAQHDSIEYPVNWAF